MRPGSRRVRLLQAAILPLFALLLGACAGTEANVSTRQSDAFGVLIMAHGGDTAWNQTVLQAVEPLKRKRPLEVAFGMARPDTLQAAVQALEERGVRRIVVVRLFVSGKSFRERTEKILGLEPGASPRPSGMTMASGEGHGHHMMPPWRIETSSTFSLSREGLAESDLMNEILMARARALSRDPSRESVLVLAHGPGDDEENREWLANLERRVEPMRRTMGFRRVAVETLREDWPERRREAERRIRDFVAQASRDGGRAIVIPFRVQGFGPYAEVLEGLDYVSDGKGLLPHPNVIAWIEDQIDRCAARGFEAPLSPAK